MTDVFKTGDVHVACLKALIKTSREGSKIISILKAIPKNPQESVASKPKNPLLLLHKEEKQTTTMPLLGWGKALVALSES